MERPGLPFQDSPRQRRRARTPTQYGLQPGALRVDGIRRGSHGRLRRCCVRPSHPPPQTQSPMVRIWLAVLHLPFAVFLTKRRKPAKHRRSCLTGWRRIIVIPPDFDLRSWFDQLTTGIVSVQRSLVGSLVGRGPIFFWGLEPYPKELPGRR